MMIWNGALEEGDLLEATAIILSTDEEWSWVRFCLGDRSSGN
jgi:hypothetical protein